MSQSRLGLGKLLSKFIETFPSNYMHATMILGPVMGHNTSALLPFRLPGWLANSLLWGIRDAIGINSALTRSRAVKTVGADEFLEQLDHFRLAGIS
jgi:hypothetical protein